MSEALDSSYYTDEYLDPHELNRIEDAYYAELAARDREEQALSSALRGLRVDGEPLDFDAAMELIYRDMTASLSETVAPADLTSATALDETDDLALPRQISSRRAVLAESDWYGTGTSHLESQKNYPQNFSGYRRNEHGRPRNARRRAN